MKPSDDNPPALPVVAHHKVFTTGQTMLDKFAGDALQGMLASGANWHKQDEIAKAAYVQAEAMLEVRKRLYAEKPEPLQQAKKVPPADDELTEGHYRLISERSEYKSIAWRAEGDSWRVVGNPQSFTLKDLRQRGWEVEGLVENMTTTGVK